MFGKRPREAAATFLYPFPLNMVNFRDGLSLKNIAVPDFPRSLDRGIKNRN